MPSKTYTLLAAIVAMPLLTWLARGAFSHYIFDGVFVDYLTGLFVTLCGTTPALATITLLRANVDWRAARLGVGFVAGAWIYWALAIVIAPAYEGPETPMPWSESFHGGCLTVLVSVFFELFFGTPRRQ
jgi:hypothetical protein